MPATFESICVARGYVIDHRLCTGCGFDLFQQPTNGSCPECGQPVLRSISHDLLSDADPVWLRSIQTAISWLHRCLMAMILALLSGIVLFVTLLVSDFLGLDHLIDQWTHSGSIGAVFGLMTIGAVGFAALGVILLFALSALGAGIAAWMLFRVEPGGLVSDRERLILMLGRRSLAVAASATPTIPALAFLAGQPTASFLIALAIALNVCWVYAAAWRVAQIARRVNRQSLNRAAERLNSNANLTLFAAIIVILSVPFAMLTFSPTLFTPSPDYLHTLLFAISSLLLAICAVRFVLEASITARDLRRHWIAGSNRAVDAVA